MMFTFGYLLIMISTTISQTIQYQLLSSFCY